MNVVVFVFSFFFFFFIYFYFQLALGNTGRRWGKGAIMTLEMGVEFEGEPIDQDIVQVQSTFDGSGSTVVRLHNVQLGGAQRPRYVAHLVSRGEKKLASRSRVCPPRISTQEVVIITKITGTTQKPTHTPTAQHPSFLFFFVD
jgi:hypothetical protein